MLFLIRTENFVDITFKKGKKAFVHSIPVKYNGGDVGRNMHNFTSERRNHVFEIHFSTIDWAYHSIILRQIKPYK